MKKLTILILSMMFLQVNAQITSYNINSTITCTDTIQPFGTHTISYGLSIDGEGQLLSDTAFIRVVLVDKNDNEWLVYERNSLYATEEDTQFQGAALGRARFSQGSGDVQETGAGDSWDERGVGFKRRWKNIGKKPINK